LIAKFLISVLNGIIWFFRCIFCCQKDYLPELPQATKNSSNGMLTLSLHLNHLLAWAATVFSISLSSKYIENTVYYLGIMSAINAVISCIAGFWIATYMIRKLEEALTD
jgi:hypothetical protein